MGDQCWYNASSVPVHHDPSFREMEGAFISAVMNIVLNISQVVLPQALLDRSREALQAGGIHKKEIQDEILAVLHPFIYSAVGYIGSYLLQRILGNWPKSPAKIVASWAPQSLLSLLVLFFSQQITMAMLVLAVPTMLLLWKKVKIEDPPKPAKLKESPPPPKETVTYRVVIKGHKTGIFTDWKEAKDAVEGFRGAIIKNFSTKKEAEDYWQKNKDKYQL